MVSKNLKKHFRGEKPKRYVEIYLYLVEQMEFHSGNMPSVKQIANHFQITEQAVYQHLAALVKYDFVEKISNSRHNRWRIRNGQFSPPAIYQELIANMEG